MVSPQLREILSLVDAYKNKVLLVAESSLPAPQYAAYRKFLLNEFGEKGLEGEIRALFDKRQQGKAGQGRE